MPAVPDGSRDITAHVALDACAAAGEAAGAGETVLTTQRAALRELGLDARRPAAGARGQRPGRLCPGPVPGVAGRRTGGRRGAWRVRLAGPGGRHEPASTVGPAGPIRGRLSRAPCTTGIRVWPLAPTTTFFVVRWRHRLQTQPGGRAGRPRERGSMGGCASARHPGSPVRAAGRRRSPVPGCPGPPRPGAPRPGPVAGRSSSSIWGRRTRRRTGCCACGSPWTATGSWRPSRRSGSCTGARKSCSRCGTTARSSCSPTGTTGLVRSPANWAWCSPRSGWRGSRCRPGRSGPAPCWPS